MNKGTAFVTGGSGFVGRNLIRTLVERGVQVRALARCNRAAGRVEACGAEPVMGDLDEFDSMIQGMRGCDAVFHAAAMVAEWGNPDDFHKVNVRGTENVVQAAFEAGVPRLVHVGTEAVYADGESSIVRVNEQTAKPRRPLPRYPATKSAAEDIVLEASDADLQCMVIRPRLIWGRDDTSLLPQLVEAVRAGRFMWIDNGEALTSTCHVDNVVEGALLAAEKGKGGGIYFLSDGDPLAMRTFLTGLLATQGVKPPTKSIPRWAARRLAAATEWSWENLNLRGTPPITRMVVELFGQEVTVDDTRARQELGYAGRVSIEAGLAGVARVT